MRPTYLRRLGHKLGVFLPNQVVVVKELQKET
jgi:hypothetical protein